MKPTYRREIDGLRALAVVPVIFFHAGFELFSGGYIGVDVFFVISGYLITSIIIDDLQNDRFSILRFYERRARRILPALIFVILVCILFAWMWMEPRDHRDFSQSLVASSIFASNVLFSIKGGYFDTHLEFMPLLHTWSLSVEEQFYVVFPIFMLFVWRFGRSPTVWIIVSVFAISLLASEWRWRDDPMANYFLAPTRAWELLAGSIAAFIVQKRGVRSNNIVSIAALAAVAVSVFAFGEHTPMPSLYALLPVGGVFLLILFGGEKTVVAKVLGSRVLVGIGLISFSAYLWHQPLFAFTRLRLFDAPPPELMATLCLATFVLAFLSWRYVEQPFRKKGGVVASRFGVFALSGVSLFVLAALGVAGHQTRGFPDRLPADARLVNDIVKETVNGCLAFDGRVDQPVKGCGSATVENGVDVVLIGDSHSARISPSVQPLLRRNGLGSYAYAYSGCPGLQRFYLVGGHSSHQCAGYNDDMLTYAREVDAEILVVTSRFPLYQRGYGFDNGEGGSEPDGDSRVDVVGMPTAVEADDAKRRERVVAAFQRELENLVEEFKVVLVYPIPAVGWNVPRRMIKCMLFIGGECDVTTSYTRYLEQTEDIRSVFDSVESPNLFRVYPADLFCNQTIVGRCDGSRDQHPLYTDDDHLASLTGAALLAPLILDAVQEAMEKRSDTRDTDGLRRQPD